jgi:hypothetical protein
MRRSIVIFVGSLILWLFLGLFILWSTYAAPTFAGGRLFIGIGGGSLFFPGAAFSFHHHRSRPHFFFRFDHHQSEVGIKQARESFLEVKLNQ